MERLLLSAERLESDLDVERRANRAYEAYRSRGRMKDGRRFGGPPNPYTPPDLPVGKVNATDPDSRPIPIGFGFVQGYNAQAVVVTIQFPSAARRPGAGENFVVGAPDETS
jgi:hypothetical protein